MGDRLKSWIAPIGVVAVAAMLTLGAVVMPASGTPVQRQSPAQTSLKVVSAKLVGKGVAMDVVIEYRCPEGGQLYGIDLMLRQRFGRSIASGYGSLWSYGLLCGGPTARQATVRVNAGSGGPGAVPFKAGQALANAWMYGCAWYDCFQVEHEQSIKVKG